MTLKFGKFKFYKAAVTEKKTSNSVYREQGPSLSAQILNEKSAFSPVIQLSLKNKTITNQQRIGCLVYPEITKVSERSL